MRKIDKLITDYELLEAKRVETIRQKEEIKAAIAIMETDEMQKALKANRLSDRQIVLFINGLRNGSISVKAEESGRLFINGKEVLKEVKKSEEA